MKHKASIILLLFFFIFPLTQIARASEPVKRQTAMEIYSVLLGLPYGADIRYFREGLGIPDNEGPDYIAYRHNRTGTILFVFKTPFDTAQSAQILEECASVDDAQMRLMLITEQFKRRFGEPQIIDGEPGGLWTITDVGILLVCLDAQDNSRVIYRLEPFSSK